MDTPRKTRSGGASSAPATLQSLQVQWSVHKNTEKEVSFHVLTTATLTRKSVAELVIKQYVIDGVSIKSGTTGTVMQYRMTKFRTDAPEAISTDQASAIYDDIPGLSKDHGIAADTDLMYVFGAKWKVTLGDSTLAETTPLIGIITGAFVSPGGRTFSPSGTVTATWDGAKWLNQGKLLSDYPDSWDPYPKPKIDNK